MKRIIATGFALLVMGAFAGPAIADQNVCAPGQHGNPNPAFKPGSCDNK